MSNAFDPYAFGNPGSDNLMNPNPAVKSILDIDPVALEQMAQWIEQRGLSTPANQATGFAVNVSTPISTAQSTANTAQSTANTANTTANTANTTANTANTTADTVQTRIDNAFNVVSTAESVSSTADGYSSWTDLATVGPSFTADQTKTFTFIYGAHIDSTTGRTGGAGGNIWADIGLNINGTLSAYVEANAQYYTGTGTVDYWPMNVVGAYSASVTTGQVVKLQYRQFLQFGSGTCTTTFSNRWLLAL